MGNKGEEVEERERGVVVVNPKPTKGFTSKAIDWLERLIVKLMYDPSRPHDYLAGNFGPVDETPPCRDLPVKGYLPDCLNGEFVRVGPNPKFAPVAGYHWFDGDGWTSPLYKCSGQFFTFDDAMINAGGPSTDLLSMAQATSMGNIPNI